jgi:hypothetical protein
MSLGAFLLITTTAMAAEELAKGAAVAREIRTMTGDRFLLTVRPPADRAVDPRIFDVIEVVSGGNARSLRSGASHAAKVWGGAAELAAAESQSNDGLVDVSDYALELEALSAASCDTGASLKFKKVNLGGKKTVTLTAAVSGMFVTVFPTKGDVDAGVYFTDDLNVPAICRFETPINSTWPVASLELCRYPGRRDPWRGSESPLQPGHLRRRLPGVCRELTASGLPSSPRAGSWAGRLTPPDARAGGQARYGRWLGGGQIFNELTAP